MLVAFVVVSEGSRNVAVESFVVVEPIEVVVESESELGYEPDRCLG